MPISVEDVKNAGDLWQPTQREGLFQCADIARFIKEMPDVNKEIKEEDGKPVPEQVFTVGEWTYKVKIDKNTGALGLIRWKKSGGSGGKGNYPAMEFNTVSISEYDDTKVMNEFLSTMSKSVDVVTQVRTMFPRGDKVLYIVEIKKPVYISRNPAAAAATKKEDNSKPAA
jgi:hypothetical protein